jgi:hypothetical protein
VLGLGEAKESFVNESSQMNVAQQIEKEGNYYDLVDEKGRTLHEKLRVER